MERVKFKALVIDDEQGRNATYHLALDEYFDITIINSIPNLTYQQTEGYDLLIIDVVLGRGKDANAFYYLKQYNIQIPTVLISGQWVSNDKPSQSILRVPEYSCIFKVVYWNDFADCEANPLGEEIYFEFCKRKNLVSPLNKDHYTLLQISDLQFGGHIAASALNDYARIAKYLKDNDIIPDILIVAGDVADKGKSAEYDEAKKWFDKFLLSLWGVNDSLLPEKRRHIIVVPGNHDYDISLSASDVYQFKFGSETIDTFEKKGAPITFSNQKQGFWNFQQFARKLTDDAKWFTYLDTAIAYENRFVNWGINICTVNSAYKINSQNCENKFGKFYCDFSALTDEDLPASVANPNLCNILIMHNAPSDFHPNYAGGDASWKRLQNIIEDNKIHICLFGHTHDDNLPFKLRGNGGPYCRNAICIPSPSLRLTSGDLTEDARRGFNIIELTKKGETIDSVKVRQFSIVNAMITEAEDIDPEKIRY